jgi:TolA-binding protein
MLGDLLLLQGDMDAALAQFASAANAQRMPFRDKNLALFRVAELLYFKGLFDSSLAKLEPLTENSSTDIANDALDLSLHIQQYKDNQKDALILYAKGMSLSRMERWNEGIAVFTGLRVKYPNSPLFDRASLQLGDMMRRAGRYNEAAVVYEDFMKAQTESILRDEILFALAALYENDLHDSARAVECYQRLLVDFPNSIHNGAARERIQYLRKGNS